MAGTTSLHPLLTNLGIDNQILTFIFFVLAIVIFLWGFERYRTNFSRTELGLSVLLGIGLLFLAFARGFVEIFASIVNIQSRFILVQIGVNITFILIILYLISLITSNQNMINELIRKLTIQKATDAYSEGYKQTIYVIIPAYNEEKTIGSVLDDLPDVISGYRIVPVVVSDGSEDRTTQIASKRDAIVTEHPLNQGQGGSLKTGFQISIRHDADIVVTMDADGQHPVDQLGDLVEPIIADDADYVFGSRYRGRDQSGNSLTRQSGIRVFTYIINLVVKMNITDCTNGYRAIRGSQLKELTLTEERFSAPELIIESRKNGLRIKEVPVTIKERESGESKKPKLRYAFGLMRTIIITWLR
jgi:hypothetical protein